MDMEENLHIKRMHGDPAAAFDGPIMAMSVRGDNLITSCLTPRSYYYWDTPLGRYVKEAR